MTLACNKRCRYCYEHTIDFSNEGRPLMTFKDFKKYFDWILYNRCVLGSRYNYLNWHFHGGEVLMIPFKELKKMVLYIEERRRYFPNLTCCMQTNGTLLNEEIINFLINHGCSVGVSYDGSKDNDRGTEEENTALRNKMEKLQKATGVPWGTLTVISKKNMKTWMEDLKDVKNFTTNPGLNALVDKDDTYTLTAEETWEYWYKPVLDSLLTPDPLKERNVMTMLTSLIWDLFFGVSHQPKSGCFSRNCAHGSSMTSLSAKGEIYPCDKYVESGDFINKRKVTSLYDYDFLGLQAVKYVYQFEKALGREEKRLGCSHCVANEFCMGDCQAYNLSRYGEIRLTDSLCNTFRKFYDYVIDHLYEIVTNISYFDAFSEDRMKYTRGLSVFGRDFLRKHPNVKLKLEDSGLYFIKEDCECITDVVDVEGK